MSYYSNGHDILTEGTRTPTQIDSIQFHSFTEPLHEGCASYNFHLFVVVIVVLRRRKRLQYWESLYQGFISLLFHTKSNR